MPLTCVAGHMRTQADRSETVVTNADIGKGAPEAPMATTNALVLEPAKQPILEQGMCTRTCLHLCANHWRGAVAK